jgi:sugar/nucleoside kinase (ribokinase family)
VSITVVGSIAYDAVRTPFGERRRMLGGAATHFALAASFFDTVRPVGPVGGDFATEDLRTLSVRGTITDDVVTVPGGETFFWSGVYGDDLNSRETLATELGVFADFQPRLSPAARACEVLFLANIQPSLQASVLDQCDGPRFTALDSMNLWIETARAELIAVIERVDCVILNDAEIRQLTGRHTLPDAARELLELGPEAVIAKQGEYGAALFTRDGFFSLPAYPLVSVVDPTGAGDTFAGGLVGYVAAARERTVSRELLAGAMAYGTALASFNVQEFGTERLARLSFDEVHARVAELHRFTQFEMPLLKETV